MPKKVKKVKKVVKKTVNKAIKKGTPAKKKAGKGKKSK
jgi:hypothetical protein